MRTIEQIKDEKKITFEGDATKIKRRDVDYTNFYALLIGVSRYPNDKKIPDIPNIEVNIRELRKVLIRIGVPVRNIVVSLNETKSEILKKLQNLAQKAYSDNHTLFLYYSGHGLINPTNYKFYFSTSDTTHEYLQIDSIKAEDLSEILKYSTAKRKILVVDSCYSGKLLNIMSDMRHKIKQPFNEVEGLYLLVSAGEDKPSFYPKNTRRPTFFTEKFISILKEGLDNGQPFIRLNDIYSEIFNDFKKRNLPLPEQKTVKNINNMIFSVNPKYDKPYIDLTQVNLNEFDLQIFKITQNEAQELKKVVEKVNLRYNWIVASIFGILLSIFGGLIYLNSVIYNTKKISALKPFTSTVAIDVRQVKRKHITRSKIVQYKDSLQRAREIIQNEDRNNYEVAFKIFGKYDKEFKIPEHKEFLEKALQSAKNLEQVGYYEGAIKYYKDAYNMTYDKKYLKIIDSLKSIK